MRAFSSCACFLAVFLLLYSECSAQQSDPGWSSRLLNEVFQDTPARGRQSTEGLILRSYQLHAIRVGEQGRAKSALQLLEKLLPSGSTLRVDIPSNTLHLLATPSAHTAAWEFISAIDVEDPASKPSPAISEEIQTVLQQIRQSQPPAEDLKKSVAAVQNGILALDEKASRQGSTLLVVCISMLGLAGIVAVLLLFRRKPPSSLHSPTPSVPGSLSLLAPESLSTALEPMQRQLQQDMLGALNAAAIRMEAWYNEQKVHRDELLQLSQNQESRLEELRLRILEENRSLLERGGNQFQASATRIEEGVKRLSEQNDKISALAAELETALRDLDASKDQIFKLQSDIEGKSSQLDQARQILQKRETDLTRQQAKLAALSLILEKGAGLPELRFDDSSSPVPEGFPFQFSQP